MSVDIFGRKLLKSAERSGTRGPPGYGFKITADGQYDMNNKRLCNVGNPENLNDAVPFGTMMTVFKSELENIQRSMMKHSEAISSLTAQLQIIELAVGRLRRKKQKHEPQDSTS